MLVSGAGVVGAGWAGVSLGAGDRFCGAALAGWPLLATDEDGGAGGVGSGVVLLVVAVPLLATLLSAGAAGIAVAVSGVAGVAAGETGAALAVAVFAELFAAVFCCVTVADSWPLSWLVV